MYIYIYIYIYVYVYIYIYRERERMEKNGNFSVLKKMSRCAMRAPTSQPLGSLSNEVGTPDPN